MTDASSPGARSPNALAPASLGRTAPPAPIKTPCIKVCVVDGESGLCLGCFRKLSEVAAWARLTDAERDAILAELPDRRSLVRPEKLAMF
ncbi:MAG: DUF1289 domain-containing protein [Caulobacterales bacterium]|nr:DUF1289 domain-containing protein [Caulobacterales bacterium]